MAKEIWSWEASDGTLYKTECAAATRDLELLIADSPCAENTPYAKIMLAWMTDQAPAILHALKEYESSCPRLATVMPDLKAGALDAMFEEGEAND